MSTEKVNEGDENIKFPFKTPDHENRFPYKDPTYYKPIIVDEQKRRMSMGFTAQCSVNLLEQMGRRPDLGHGHLPWFRAVWQRR